MKALQFIGLFLFLLLFTAVCHAQDETQPQEEVYKDWALRPSPEGETWILEQRVFLKGNDQTPLVHMAIQPFDIIREGHKEKGQLWVMLRTPLGVQLQTGVQFQVDQDDPFRIAFHHCRAAGCIALWPLNSDLRAKLEAGNEARATYQALSGESIGIPISLIGVKAGLTALDRKTAEAVGKKTE